ncbi:AMP-binding protein [Nonomuraea mesophila]|uniref:AMP-binding protein n=1 Tax=Nonomuraea mesophila TaxID=2530382 RepID=UPI0015F2D4CA|nr:AMP-binding protein [Nonomuraea mesophila]
MDVSIGTIWEAVARRLPGAVAICEPGRDHTYAEFDDRAARLATALERAGVGPGDRADVTIVDALASSEGGPFAFAITSATEGPRRDRGHVPRHRRRPPLRPRRPRAGRAGRRDHLPRPGLGRDQHGRGEGSSRRRSRTRCSPTRA